MRKDTGNLRYAFFFRREPMLLQSYFELSLPPKAHNKTHPVKVPGVLKFSVVLFGLHLSLALYFGG